MLQGSLHPNFLQTFGEAVNAYLDGDWQTAKARLDAVAEMRPDDGPSGTLHKVMGKTNYVAPADWAGYRALTEK